MNRYMEQCPLKLGAIGNVILPSFMQITLATFVRYQEQQWTFSSRIASSTSVLI